MIDWERKNKNRIVYENKGAVAFAPFASREPFEIKIFPKKHLSYFEDTSEKDLKFVSEALRTALLKAEINLKDPDYNFFIHTSPVSDKKSIAIIIGILKFSRKSAFPAALNWERALRLPWLIRTTRRRF